MKTNYATQFKKIQKNIAYILLRFKYIVTKVIIERIIEINKIDHYVLCLIVIRPTSWYLIVLYLLLIAWKQGLDCKLHITKYISLANCLAWS